MKLNVPLLLASASLVIASPLRVVVTSHQEVSSGPGNDAAVARISNVVAQVYPPPPGAPGSKHHCSGFRDKAMELSNRIFGFPALAPPPPSVWIMNHGPVVAPFVSADPAGEHERPHMHGHHHGVEDDATDSNEVKVHMRPAESGEDMQMAQPLHGAERGGPHRDFAPVHIMHMGGHRHRSFLRRMHFALMALGPWEGRAVAFVLGCGIGVLLRMIFVIGVVLVRAIKARRSAPQEEVGVIFVGEAERSLPPPQYTEKQSLPLAEEKPAAEAQAQV